VAFVSDRDGTTAIYVANADGSSVTRVTTGERPAWSRDGRLAFQRGSAIFVINVDGSGLRQIAQGSGPAWSPDGARVAFSRGSTEIVTVNADGSGAAVLVSHALVSQGSTDILYGAHSPAWSPDGRTVACIRASWDDVWQVYLINADGSGFRSLTNGNEGRWTQAEPAWSPDGTAIAFSGVNGIGVAYADGSGWILGQPRGLPSFNAALQVFNPDWTPDGRLIFDRATSPDGRGRLRIFLGDAGVERQLIPEATTATLSGYSDRQAVWFR
jgi:Tol biopolymer transport system component